MDDRGKQHDGVREEVSEFYAKAVARTGGCCAGASLDGVAALSGYGADELAGLPDDAVASAFGCGNPLAFGEVAPGDVVVDLGSGAGSDLISALSKCPLWVTSRRAGPETNQRSLDAALRGAIFALWRN